MVETRKTTSSSSSSSVTRVPEFFKVFLSPQSFYKMKIPVEFLDQLTCETPESISLIGPSGKVWRVCLLEMDDGYYFEKGWQDFVIDNFMINEDFCVFQYVNEGCLQVQIFEQNGCERESAFQANCSQAQACTTNCSAGHKVKKEVENQAEIPSSGPLISLRRAIKKEEENMALRGAQGFISQNPYTMITVRNSHVYTGSSLPLPVSFWKVNLPHHTQSFIVRDPRGKAWDVKFHCDAARHYGGLTVGWRKISFANSIEASDVCILELVKPNELKLHIFRVVEELKRSHH
ncbi:hypothetical protein MKW94_021800 [Papaver nudicaule]|uniref:TF-B3 domain-containing protein n=1 Tax=Papaver nudicaule TaxID=74823 RepID=A0AA41SK66_PAPNU|nr:hypothetical protein [Papaver nudicaule]